MRGFGPSNFSGGNNMKKNAHNGFLLKYSGEIFPASSSNQITYEYFCLLGGLSNERLRKIERNNGPHIYNTYHKVDAL